MCPDCGKQERVSLLFSGGDGYTLPDASTEFCWCPICPCFQTRLTNCRKDGKNGCEVLTESDGPTASI